MTQITRFLLLLSNPQITLHIIIKKVKDLRKVFRRISSYGTTCIYLWISSLTIFPTGLYPPLSSSTPHAPNSPFYSEKRKKTLMYFTNHPSSSPFPPQFALYHSNASQPEDSSGDSRLAKKRKVERSICALKRGSETKTPRKQCLCSTHVS